MTTERDSFPASPLTFDVTAGGGSIADGEAEEKEEETKADGEAKGKEEDEEKSAIDHPHKELDTVEPQSGNAVPDNQEAQPQPEAHPEARKPQALKAPRSPTPKEVDEHVLTHVPYADWCEVCRGCRRPNAAHRFKGEDDRACPMRTVEYCVLHARGDAEPFSVAIARVGPSRLCLGIPVEAKGNNREGVGMLSNISKGAGLTTYIWRSDQEKAVKTMVEQAMLKAGRDAEEQKSGQIHQPVPEHSAVGESASNGFAERRVPKLEDLVRTMTHALQARLDETLGVNHPVISWLIVHAGNVLNKYHSHEQTGQTAYAHLHGRDAPAAVAECGKECFITCQPIPKRTWMRGGFQGVYLGRVLNADEYYIGTSKGV